MAARADCQHHGLSGGCARLDADDQHPDDRCSDQQGEQSRGETGARPAAGEARQLVVGRLELLQELILASEGEQVRSSLEEINHFGANGPAYNGLPPSPGLVNAAITGERRRHSSSIRARARQRARRDPPHDGDRGGCESDDEGHKTAQVQVLERVDIVDGSREQVATAPRSQPGGERGSSCHRARPASE